MSESPHVVAAPPPWAAPIVRLSHRGELPLAAGFLLLLAIAGLSIWLVVAEQSQSKWVGHSMHVEEGASRLLALIEEAEAGARGYLLTHDASNLQAVDIGLSAAPVELANLKRLTRDNPRQQAELAALEPLVDTKLARFRNTARLARDKGDFEGALTFVRSGRGQILTRAIRTRITRIQDEEDRILDFRREQVRRTGKALLAASLAGVVGVTLLAIIAIRSLRGALALVEKREAQLKATNDGLESLVAERTRQLTESNEDLQSYAYIVSHDLRAPLVNVMGFTSELEVIRAELAAELASDPKAAQTLADFDEALSFIKAGAARMEMLLRSILKISREGRRAYHPEPLDMKALVEGLVAAQHHQAQAAGAEVVVEDLPEITADRLAVEQVLGNLLDNALKYLDPVRPGRIEISGERRGPVNVYRVKDNGRGIARADSARVFELFRRSGPQNRPGEGIGLAHVKALVRSLGGRIDLDSELGVGTTFTVTLPRVPTATT